jgi:hypothetical protein
MCRQLNTLLLRVEVVPVMGMTMLVEVEVAPVWF